MLRLPIAMLRGWSFFSLWWIAPGFLSLRSVQIQGLGCPRLVFCFNLSSQPLACSGFLNVLLLKCYRFSLSRMVFVTGSLHILRAGQTKTP